MAHKIYTKNTWLDRIISGALRYDIKDNAGTSLYSQVQLLLYNTVTQAGSALTSGWMNNIETGIDTLDTAVNNGWYPITDTWTYASANTITVPTDATTYLQKGVKIKLTQGGVTKYFVGQSVAATLITVFVNTDYTVANSAITDIYYSYAENPYGWPGYFNYTPALTNVSGYNSAKFNVMGDIIKWEVLISGKNATGAGTIVVTAPTTPASALLYGMQINDGTVYAQAFCYFSGSSFNIFKNMGTTTWAGTETNIAISIDLSFRY